MSGMAHQDSWISTVLGAGSDGTRRRRPPGRLAKSKGAARSGRNSPSTATGTSGRLDVITTRSAPNAARMSPLVDDRASGMDERRHAGLIVLSSPPAK